ncbi:hypothetical protein SLS58_006490 [Diplodia intermedia]|uniref:Uncharacterized protein n=1 Tax=Diplodia intermedia TaxID=856260 RepID=A0ABR3TMM9_9PEZI
MASTILLKGGTLLIHDDDDHVVPTKADLIAGNTISCIAPNIPKEGIGETQLKSRHADQTFLAYMPSGQSKASSQRPAPQTDDAGRRVKATSKAPTTPPSPTSTGAGQLGCCLELLNAGTTTHAHMTTSPEVGK